MCVLTRPGGRSVPRGQRARPAPWRKARVGGRRGRTCPPAPAGRPATVSRPLQLSRQPRRSLAAAWARATRPVMLLLTPQPVLVPGSQVEAPLPLLLAAAAQRSVWRAPLALQSPAAVWAAAANSRPAGPAATVGWVRWRQVPCLAVGAARRPRGVGSVVLPWRPLACSRRSQRRRRCGQRPPLRPWRPLAALRSPWKCSVPSRSIAAPWS